MIYYETIANQMYEAWRTEGRRLQANWDAPEWADLGPISRDSWIAAARKAVELVRIIVDN